MSRVRPILFNTDMVRAILDGRKTVTRRLVKPQHLRVLNSHYHEEHPEVGDMKLLSKLCEPPCHPGDILYVREAWNVLPYSGESIYRADCDLTDKFLSSLKWRPSIHMPKKAARIWLKVTDVRVERLQDITEEQAQKEGFEGKFVGTGEAMGSGWDVTPVDEFSELWDTTIKQKDRVFYGWAANPWVWVIEFEPFGKPAGWPE